MLQILGLVSKVAMPTDSVLRLAGAISS